MPQQFLPYQRLPSSSTTAHGLRDQPPASNRPGRSSWPDGGSVPVLELIRNAANAEAWGYLDETLALASCTSSGILPNMRPLSLPDETREHSIVDLAARLRWVAHMELMEPLPPAIVVG